MDFEKMFEIQDDENELNEIINEIKNYDIIDFISRVSSLNLLPYNQNKCIVFDAIINAILQKNIGFFGSKHIMSGKKFRAIIDKCMKLNVGKLIDPIEMPFVHRVFYFGNHWIFPGISTNIGYNLQHILNIIFKYKNNFSKDFLLECTAITEIVLNISTKIAEKLGYGIDSLKHYEKSSVDYPDYTKTSILCEAITIDTSIIQKFLSPDEEKEFYATFGESETDTLAENYYGFFGKPFLKTAENKAIVLNPSILPIFLINKLLKIAINYGVYDDIVIGFNNSVWNDCKRSLASLGHKKIDESSIDIVLMNTDEYKETLVTASNDGVLFVQFICDNGNDFNFFNPFETYQIQNEGIAERWEYIYSKVKDISQNRVYQLIILNSFERGVYFGFDTKQSDKTLKLSPFELMCVSINELNHENFIPLYIENKLKSINTTIDHDSDIYAITLYSGNNYSFYFKDDIDTRKVDLHIGYGDSIDYINKALIQEDRQLVLAPGFDYYKEIVLNDDIRNIYCSTTKNKFELLNRFCNIDIWITSEQFTSSQMMKTSYTIIDLITYWLSELKEMIEKADFTHDLLEIRIILNGNLDDYYIEKTDDELKIDKYIDFGISGSIITMVFSPNAFSVLDLDGNIGEKALMLCVINQICNFCSSSLDYECFEKAFENPLKKKVYSLDYERIPYYKPIDDNLRLIPIEYEEMILNDIGDYLINTEGMTIGIIDETNRVSVCEKIVSFLYEKLQTTVATINKKYFYEIVYYDLEKILHQMMLTQKRFSLDLCCYPERRDKIISDYNHMNKSSVAIKFLMEYIAAEPPTGEKTLSELDYGYLLAVCSSIIEWAHNGDLYKFKIINSKLSILKSGRIGINKDQLNHLYTSNFSAGLKRIEDISNPYIETFSPEKVLVNFRDVLDSAFKDEFGYSFTDFTKCIKALIIEGETLDSEIKRFNFDVANDAVSKSTQLSAETTKRIIDDLSLKPRSNYLCPPLGFEKSDIWPWRFNRRLSFNRRPIIQTDKDIIWGNRQLYHCLLFTLDLINQGKFKANNNGALSVLIGKISNRRGDYFNDTVYEKLKKFDSIIVDKKVSKLNGQKILGEDKNQIGDIDVLLIVPKKKKIIVAELKDFSFSKTPYEMYQEYNKMFCDKGEKLCYYSKHSRRVEWIKSHINDVVSHYKLTGDKWKVNDVLILSEPFPSNEYYHRNKKILLYADLSERNIMSI